MDKTFFPFDTEGLQCSDQESIARRTRTGHLLALHLIKIFGKNLAEYSSVARTFLVCHQAYPSHSKSHQLPGFTRRLLHSCSPIRRRHTFPAPECAPETGDVRIAQEIGHFFDGRPFSEQFQRHAMPD
jgi:hypothetical protein